METSQKKEPNITTQFLIPSPKPMIFTNLKNRTNYWIDLILAEIKFDPVGTTRQGEPSHFYALRGEANTILLQGTYGRHCPIQWGSHLLHLRNSIQATLNQWQFNVVTLNLFLTPQHHLRTDKWTEHIATSSPMLFVSLGTDIRIVELQTRPSIQWNMTQGSFALAPPNTRFKVLRKNTHQTHNTPWILLVFRRSTL